MPSRSRVEAARGREPTEIAGKYEAFPLQSAMTLYAQSLSLGAGGRREAWSISQAPRASHAGLFRGRGRGGWRLRMRGGGVHLGEVRLEVLLGVGELGEGGGFVGDALVDDLEGLAGAVDPFGVLAGAVGHG